MKTFPLSTAMARLTAIILLTSSFLLHPSSLLSQGFNYQAVVRGGDNLPLASQNVGFRFSILDAAQASVYTETQNTATNALGMVSLVIGEADAVSFASIHWGAGGFSLKVEMDPAGGNNYTLHETKPMQLVPYSLYAGKAGAVGAGKIEVTGDASQSDEEALFEVKRNDGQTVFAVYPDGVRVYVEDPPGKGSKGGFAVGGFDPTKGLTSEFLRVTPDSVRIYIEEGGSKGPKGGFAVGGFDPAKGPTNDYFNISGKSNAETYAGEPRVLWYPIKEAFLVGNVLVESPDSVGTNSWASGYRSKAIGNYSQALGYQAIARGNYSTAIGYNPVADSLYSFAIGQNATSSHRSSYAIGEGARATGYKAYALGYLSKAYGLKSYAIGSQNLADGETAMALGHSARALGNSSVALGRNSQAEAYHSIAMGVSDDAGQYWTTASGSKSVAIGTNSKSRKAGSFTFGYWLDNNDDYSVVLGKYNTPVSSGTSLIVGNGAGDSNRSNAMIVYDNGNVTIAGNLTENSDIRLKKNIVKMGPVVDKIGYLNPVYYDFEKQGSFPEGRQAGLIAQDIQMVFPELVVSDNDGFLSVNYSKLSVLLLKAIQEQQSQINELKSLLNELVNK